MGQRTGFPFPLRIMVPSGKDLTKYYNGGNDVMTESSKNLLYYGDNLDILRRYVKDETVDLVYLDPPFNSNANYNVLFRKKTEARPQARFRLSRIPGHGIRKANPSLRRS